jgi:hypothetical protein
MLSLIYLQGMEFKATRALTGRAYRQPHEIDSLEMVKAGATARGGQAPTEDSLWQHRPSPH